MFLVSLKARSGHWHKSYSKTFLLLVALQTLYFSPMVLQRAVIFPHNNGFEVSGLVIEDNSGITNRKFSDLSNVYIPEINQHLHGNHQAWLSTWNPHVQLGRPTFQLSGFGKAYLLTHILSAFIDNPFILNTCLTLLTIYLIGIFCFLLLKALELHPLACFSIAAGLSLGTFCAYWFTFVVFLATLCWTLALLWLITEFVRHKSFATAAGIAFASYSLLMTGYPQFIVSQVYLISGFTLMRLWQSTRDLKAKVYSALVLVGVALVGAVTALPAYLDVLTNAQRSPRLLLPDEHFLGVLPTARGLKYLTLFLSQLFDSFWFGNPISAEYPLGFDGLSLTVFYFFLLLLSLADGQWRRLWPWQLFVAACLLATTWPPAYRFMVRYLGFNLSRSLPLGGAIIPAFVLGGYTLDRILRQGLKSPLLSVALFVFPLLLASIVGFNEKPKLRISFVIVCLALTLGSATFVITRKPVLLVLLTIASVWIYGFTLLLTKPISEIQTNSNLVDTIRRETADGSRFALVGRNFGGIVPANQESLLQINSIHSYDSLASQNYQRLTEQLSGEGSVTFRKVHISLPSGANLDQAPFSYTGVSLLLSRDKLNATQFKEINEINGVRLSKSVMRPILDAQLTDFSFNEQGGVVLPGPLDKQSRLHTKKIVAKDDFMRFQVTPDDQETLLFVSQQSHPYWQATSERGPLSTVTINDFYLGVRIPSRTTDIQLRFKPYVLWSWIPQVIYIGLGFGLLVAELRVVIKARGLSKSNGIAALPR